MSLVLSVFLFPRLLSCKKTKAAAKFYVCDSISFILLS